MLGGFTKYWQSQKYIKIGDKEEGLIDMYNRVVIAGQRGYKGPNGNGTIQQRLKKF